MFWKYAANLQENTQIPFQHGCSPAHLLHIFRAPFPKNTSGRMLLDKITTFHGFFQHNLMLCSTQSHWFAIIFFLFKRFLIALIIPYLVAHFYFLKLFYLQIIYKVLVSFFFFHYHTHFWHVLVSYNFWLCLI